MVLHIHIHMIHIHMNKTHMNMTHRNTNNFIFQRCYSWFLRQTYVFLLYTRLRQPLSQQMESPLCTASVASASPSCRVSQQNGLGRKWHASSKSHSDRAENSLQPIRCVLEMTNQGLSWNDQSRTFLKWRIRFSLVKSNGGDVTNSWKMFPLKWIYHI